MCCFPPLALLFGGLGILFGVISKGTYARPGNAKAGMALSSAGIAIVAAIILFFASTMLSTVEGRTFVSQYLHILTHPEQYTEDDIYNFLQDYLYRNTNPGGGSYDNSTSPYGGEDLPDSGGDQDHYYPAPDEVIILSDEIVCMKKRLTGACSRCRTLLQYVTVPYLHSYYRISIPPYQFQEIPHYPLYQYDGGC